ncbi:DUF4307 domain-containing protein [Microbacterium ulmi]|uniref:DUF4307 domain-containing protein n=1 Tax=Microbacterium ulmi TaxID=179095 RepID=A0A7Y2LZF1_9MICO|nr:DUF4307 domain-containing protein [Microbacterium ulmi]NII68194.1 hypothetical protein [Microbacterium ulmi]NNH02328.1 DUF4307 domain-containing protein [Microbacterium ulmi]
MTTTQDKLDERYGRRRSPRARWVAGILIAVAAIAVGAYAWLTVASALDDVAAETTGFRVEDSRTVTLEFQLTVPAGRDVACVLEAQDEQHGVVGWRVVQFAASDDHTRAFSEAIPTVATATTGLVNSCWVT